ncbi:MAG: NCS2 family permease [Firmicutes bacterium]|nr:NCS2 family permease [Bacillota bacterium]
MEKLFQLKAHNTDIKTEIIAGITTFLSMVYILAINPLILSDAGLSASSVFTATAVSAGFATLFMAFYANYPIALAPGMGLNAYFAYSVCLPLAKAGIDDPYTIALTAVFCEGMLFILLTLTKFRENLVNKVPANLKLGITGGIGLFIVIVGMKDAGVVIADPDTLIALGDLSAAPVALSMLGFLIIAILSHYRVTGAILWGILATWVLGMLAQLAGWYDAAAGGSLFPDFSGGMMPAAPTMFAFNFKWAFTHLLEFVVILFSFFFVDLFDTAGTLVGVASKGGLLDENGDLPRASKALMCDALGTVAGACLGTSTVSSYVESSAGVSAGGRTGFTSVITGGLFLLSLLLSPLFLAIPGFATAPALTYVGFLMLSAVKDMDFSEDMADAVAGFLALIMMPFTYSIANGIMFGILAHVIIRICQKRAKEVHPVMWISAALFVLRILTLIFPVTFSA